MPAFLKKHGPAYLLVTLVAAAVYWHTLFFGLTALDDDVLISSNTAFLHSLANIPTAFATDAFYLKKSVELYRPLQTVSYILDAQWGGNLLFHLHLTNLLLHLACCLVVYHLLLEMAFRERLALLGALVYAVHYLFMTAVAWIPARGDLLLSLFAFLSLLTLIRLVQRPGPANLALHLAAFTLAIFTKETSVVLPFILAGYLLLFKDRGGLKGWYRFVPGYYLLVVTGFLLLRHAAVAPSEGQLGIGPFLKNIRSVPEMVAKFVAPLNLSTLPAYQTAATATGVLAIIALVLLHLVKRECLNRQLFFALAWFTLLMAPGMAYFPNFYTFCYEHVDHRAYLICFALVLMFLNVAQVLAADQKRFFLPLSVVLLVCLASLNIHFSSHYRGPLEFAANAVETNPDSALGFSLYGTQLLERGDEEAALVNLSRSLAMVRQFLPSLHYRAIIYHNRQMNREALADLDTLLATEPEYGAADYQLRGVIKAEMADYAGARQDFAAALRLDPRYLPALSALRELDRIGQLPRVPGAR